MIINQINQLIKLSEFMTKVYTLVQT